MIAAAGEASLVIYYSPWSRTTSGRWRPRATNSLWVMGGELDWIDHVWMTMMI